MTSPRRKPNSSQGDRPDEQPGGIGGEEIRDDEGLLVDEYSSEAFGDPNALDALDVPRALVDESVLEDVPDTGGGLDEVDPTAASLDEEEGDMGLGAEPRSTEELADAAIGRELRGKRGVTRDDEEHGEHLLDRAPGEDE
jgi:hypothetical protein